MPGAAVPFFFASSSRRALALAESD